ncbi:Na(+)-translocating NADH-quinone reductase subunit C [Pelagibaculum spongiae]|uniref:Na(+)-translocating NADH-quinone reductase subunit C n=1 Tax=Pelagibaculum spongiae TaxID=2080658 RepID=A0A2V1H0Y2_9GAMM|nr:Na(+)-translocating NADH-quinone reductase subunit C [Pelagibaculum spongiae]PVZ69743.1 Na(+)-translocating NADH-quinone reductase subunit C [Pelagibaculum spongiae]
MSKQDSTLKTLSVALLVCLVCSVIVAGAAVTLKPIQQINKVLDKKRNILAAAGLLKPGMGIEDTFAQIDVRVIDIRTGEYVEKDVSKFDQRKAAKDPSLNIELDRTLDTAQIKRQAKNALVYLVKRNAAGELDRNGELEQVIFPVHGYGLWSTMYGFLAVKKDLNTIVGLGFYEHGETPGLGGEIDNPRWQAKWQGKYLLDGTGQVKFDIVKGAVVPGNAAEQFQVDGLSGATLTSNGVENMILFWLGEEGFGPYISKHKA